MSVLAAAELDEIVEEFRAAHPLIAAMLEVHLRAEMGFGEARLGHVATFALRRRMVDEIHAHRERPRVGQSENGARRGWPCSILSRGSLLRPRER